jgi:hypothetical protein
MYYFAPDMRTSRCFPFHVIAKRVPLGEYGFFKSVYISLQDAAESDWKATNEA